MSTGELEVGEFWNPHDPSQHFLVAYPMSAAQGTTNSSVMYMGVEPGHHGGLRACSAEQIIFVSQGECEAYVGFEQIPLQPEMFTFVPAFTSHDVYALGGESLKLICFFSAAAVEITFQDRLLPTGESVLRTPAAPALEIPGDEPAAEVASDEAGEG